MSGLVQFYRSWTTPPRLTRLLIAVATVGLLVEAVYAIYWRTNDFSVHLYYGEFFLAGTPFQVEAFYPLGRMWLNAGLASLNYYVARSVCYIAAVVLLGLTFRMWTELARPVVTLPSEKRTAAIGWTIAVLLPYLIRDLDECGLQLFLLFFLTAAGYTLAHRRVLQCGFWLGLAIIYKATPLLFLALLVWKREWRAAAATMFFTIALSLLPATYLGWDGMLAAQGRWVERTAAILELQQAYPSVPGIEPPKTQNVGLKALIARYVETLPAGHPLHVDHPLFVQFGSLDPQTAKRAVGIVILVIGAGIAWTMRRRWTEPLENSRFAPEWAVACLFAALMSPLCWRQHLVMVIPCVYLVAHERLVVGAVGGWRKLIPIVAACVILFSRREIIGEDLAHVLLTYKLDTLAVLSYAALSMTMVQPATRVVCSVDDALQPHLRAA